MPFAKRNRETITMNWMLLIRNCNSSLGTEETFNQCISASGTLKTTFKVVIPDLISMSCPPKHFFVPSLLSDEIGDHTYKLGSHGPLDY